MQLKYTVKGKPTGKEIVLIHGWAKTASIKSLEPLQSELAEKGFRVWNLELPGFGGSEKAPDSWGTPEFAKEVARFIKNKVLEKPGKKHSGRNSEYYLFGHSFGGSLATFIAANLEPKPKKLILCSTAGLRYRTLKAWAVLPFSKLGKLILFPLPKKLKLKIKKGIYYYVIRERDYIDTNDKKEQFQRVTRFDMKEIFKKVSIPTLILWGKEDKITPLKMGTKINKLIDSSDLQIVEGRHGIPFTKTNELAQLIEKFIGNSRN